MIFFVNADSNLRKETEIITDILKPFAGEDIMDRNSRKYT